MESPISMRRPPTVGGSAYLADNAAELEDALQQAISQIVAATFTFASPVIPTTSTTGSDKVYTAAFQTDAARPFWRGYLKAYQRDSNGMVPVDANGVPLTSSLVWEAGALLSCARVVDTNDLHRGQRYQAGLYKGQLGHYPGTAGRRNIRRSG